MMDTNLIRKKLSELENNIRTLERLQSYSLTDLQNDREKAWSVEHGLQLSIQIIIDTGNHILAAKWEQEIDLDDFRKFAGYIEMYLGPLQA